MYYSSGYIFFLSNIDIQCLIFQLKRKIKLILFCSYVFLPHHLTYNDQFRLVKDSFLALLNATSTHLLQSYFGAFVFLFLPLKKEKLSLVCVFSVLKLQRRVCPRCVLSIHII